MPLPSPEVAPLQVQLMGPEGATAVGDRFRAVASRGDESWPVSVLVLAEGPGKDPAVRERLEASIERHRVLRVRSIEPIRELVAFDGRTAVIGGMPQGELLTSLVAGRRMPVRATVEFGVKLALALHDAAAVRVDGQLRPMRLPHHGLTTDSVLLTRSGELRILDHGLFSALKDGLPDGHDVFCLGGVLYACLRGEALPDALLGWDERPAIEDEDEKERTLALKAQERSASSARSWALDAFSRLPAPFRELVAEMLHLDPLQRPLMRDVARRLKGCAADMPGEWLSVWAGNELGVKHAGGGVLQSPAWPEPPELAPPESAEDELSDESLAERRKRAGAPLGPLRPRGVDEAVVEGVRRVPANMLVYAVFGLAALALAAIFSGPVVTRWWLDNHGDAEQGDRVKTELLGPSAVADAREQAGLEPLEFEDALSLDPPELPAESMDVVVPDDPRALPRTRYVAAKTPDGIVEVDLLVPLASRITVTCADHTPLTALDEGLRFAIPAGHCRVYAVLPAGTAWGHLVVQDSGYATCRVRFDGQLFCTVGLHPTVEPSLWQ